MFDNDKHNDDMGIFYNIGPSPEEMAKCVKHTHILEVESIDGAIRVYPVMRRIDFLDAWGYEWYPSMQEAENGGSGEFFGYCEGVLEREAVNPERIINIYNEYMMNAE